jgi:translocation and assembly module TamB
LNSLTSGEGQDLIGAATALGISKSGLLTEKIASTFGLDQFSLSGSTAQDASIVVGKYINPRLYLSYGLGIVDRISTARLNYKLSNSFSLEAERGQEAGVDVFYNIEK